jgi:hypothetical protein
VSWNVSVTNNSIWNLLFLIMLRSLLMWLVHLSFCFTGARSFFHVLICSLFFCSLGVTITTFTASYWNYPSGHALKKLHGTSESMSCKMSMHLTIIFLEKSLLFFYPLILSKYWSFTTIFFIISSGKMLRLLHLVKSEELENIF